MSLSDKRSTALFLTAGSMSSAPLEAKPATGVTNAESATEKEKPARDIHGIKVVASIAVFVGEA